VSLQDGVTVRGSEGRQGAAPVLDDREDDGHPTSHRVVPSLSSQEEEESRGRWTRMNTNRDRIRFTIQELSEVLVMAESLEASQLVGLLAQQEHSLLEGVLRLSRVHAELLAMQLDALSLELATMESSPESDQAQGCSAEEIAALPLQICEGEAALVGASCVICQESIGMKQMVRVLHCAHCYHQTCIDRWLALKPRCPLCNAVVGDR